MSDKVTAAEKQKKIANFKYMRDKDRELVKGIFRFYEVPGATLNFSTRFYKEDPVERWELVDGKVYSIPLGVAKHLNKSGWYPQYAYARAADFGAKPGTQTFLGYGPDTVMRVAKKIRRYGFQSLDFIDDSDLEDTGHTSVVTVSEYNKPSADSSLIL